jgi:hypothetical protein
MPRFLIKGNLEFEIALDIETRDEVEDKAKELLSLHCAHPTSYDFDLFDEMVEIEEISYETPEDDPDYVEEY